MAKFEMQLPTEIMQDVQKLNSNYEQIFGGMTKAGAEVVMENVQQNMPESFKKSNIRKCLKMTRIYKTPSDDGINTKVAFYGYFINHKGVRTPAPLVGNIFEYGKSNFTKRPFMRRSFSKARIQKAMLEAQKKLSGGLLDE